MNNISSDIYRINEFVEEIKMNNINESEQTLAMGIFGHLGDVLSNMIQNNIIIGTEYVNEMFPTRVKYEKNILDHAMINKITDINASPAEMQITLCLLESELLENMDDKNRFYVDKESPIFIGDFEFHLEYNIIITKSVLNNNDIIYTARYDMSRINPISTETLPYLPTPVIVPMNKKNFVFISCKIRQIEFIKQYKKLITNNMIDNKSFEFELENQLASFDLHIEDGNIKSDVIPMLQNSIVTQSSEKYCFYNYIEADTIRVIFVRDSYTPNINSNITILIQTTQGEAGNFIYKEDIITSISSEKYDYNNISILVKPLSDSLYGENKKSIEELKKIIPREALSRGSITNNKDLTGFFDSIDTDNNKLKIVKKADNQIERIFYSYLLLKDGNNNIVPSNTINLMLNKKDFSSTENDRYILRPGTKVLLENNIGRIIPKYEIIDDNEKFVYTIPFLLIINKVPLYTSYYLNIISKKYQMKFKYINEASDLQFISLHCNFDRKYIQDRDTYKLKMQIMQNITSEKGMIVKDEDGKIIENNMKLIAIMYNEENAPHRYIEGKITNYEDKTFIFDYEFELQTTDIIDIRNYIRINNVSDLNVVNNSYGYFSNNANVDIYILYKSDIEYGRYDLDTLVPGLEGYTVSNVYEIQGGLDFFFNYSHIINSKTTVSNTEEESFIVKSVPVVREKYLNSEERVKELVNILDSKRNYINHSLQVLEDNFSIDFKLYNTYGPSLTFKIDAESALDRVNISLKFEIGLTAGTGKTIVEVIKSEIKTYIENLNNLNNIHISNLITEITNNHRSELAFIEFLGCNNYDVGKQYFERMDSLDTNIIPEFINIHSKDCIEPDITVNIV